MHELTALIDEFVAQLTTLVELDALERVRDQVSTAFGGASELTAGSRALRRQRRKGPIQLCPVPRCPNRAAPVFGMVCADHKDLPKAKIRQYREARRAQRLMTKNRKSRGRAAVRS